MNPDIEASIRHTRYEVAYDRVNAALDATRTLADNLNRGPGGREASLAITKLQEAQYWLDQSAVMEQPR